MKVEIEIPENGVKLFNMTKQVFELSDEDLALKCFLHGFAVLTDKINRKTEEKEDKWKI